MLDRLEILDFRNIVRAELSELGPINLIVGANASGKTSLIEAIYLLGRARSFRSTQIRPVIRHGAERLVVFGRIGGAGACSLGVERSSRTTRIRISGEDVQSRAELVQRLPLQLITPESHRLFELGPKLRRQFLDWAVFHVEPGFHEAWRQTQTALRQRNALLRSRGDSRALAPWDQALAEAGTRVNQLRQSVAARLEPVFQGIAEKLLDMETPRLEFSSGWPSEQALGDVLGQTRSRDLEKGFTQSGPHRADLGVEIGGRLARDVVSRGQQKLLIAALSLAQAELLAADGGLPCILLVDDLPAELDQIRREKFLNLLARQPGQVFVSATDRMLLEFAGRPDSTVFHVEHGKINAAT